MGFKIKKVTLIVFVVTGFCMPGIVQSMTNLVSYQNKIMEALYNHIDTLHFNVTKTINSAPEMHLSGSVKEMAISRLDKIIKSFKTLDPSTLVLCKYQWSFGYSIPIIFKEYADAINWVMRLMYDNSRSDYEFWKNKKKAWDALSDLCSQTTNINWGCDKVVEEQLNKLSNYRSNISNLLNYHVEKLQKLILPEAISLTKKLSSQDQIVNIMYKNIDFLHKNIIDIISSAPNCGMSYLDKKNVIEKLNDIMGEFGLMDTKTLITKNNYNQFIVPDMLFKRYGEVLNGCYQTLKDKPSKFFDIIHPTKNKIHTRYLYFNYSRKFEDSPVHDQIKKLEIKIESENLRYLIKVTGGLALGLGLITVGTTYFWPNIFVYLCKNNYVSAVRGIIAQSNQVVRDSINYNDCQCLREAAKNGNREIVEMLLTNNTTANIAAKNYEAVFYALKNNDKDMINLFFTRLKINNEFNTMIQGVYKTLYEQFRTGKISQEDVQEIVHGHLMFDGMIYGKKVSESIMHDTNKLHKFYVEKLKYGCFYNEPHTIEFAYKKLQHLAGNVYDINTITHAGESLLHCAIRYGNEDAVKMLLKLGHNPNCVNKYGDTPLQLAQKKNYDDIVNILLTSETINIENTVGFENRLEIIKVLSEVQNHNDKNVKLEHIKYICNLIKHKHNLKPLLDKLTMFEKSKKEKFDKKIAHNIVSFISANNL